MSKERFGGSHKTLGPIEMSGSRREYREWAILTFKSSIGV